MSTTTHRMSNKRSKSKKMEWVPVLKTKLEEKFTEEYMGETCDTAHFVLNGAIAIVCHQLYADKTNYYPDDWPTSTIEVILSELEYPSYPPKPVNPELISILQLYPSDLDGYDEPDHSMFYNRRLYNYDGTVLYQLLTHFTNMGAELMPLSNLKRKCPIYINDHGYG